MSKEEQEQQRRSFAAGNLAMHTGEPVDVVRKRIDDMLDGPAHLTTVAEQIAQLLEPLDERSRVLIIGEVSRILSKK